MNKPKILILGGTGFIGRNIYSYLFRTESWERTLDVETFYTTTKENKDLKLGSYLIVDLTKREEVEELFNFVKPDIVIHCAAVTTNSKDVVEAPWNHVTDNTLMNALVFEACHRYKVKHCIFMSCSVMYQPKDYPQKESDWNPGDEIYPAYFGVGNMKVYSERLCEFYSKLGQCKFTVIRNSNVFGPYDKTDPNKSHVVAATIRKVIEAKDSIEIWGDQWNQARRDIIYVKDLVDLVGKVIEKQTTPFERFNCGVGEAFSVSEIVGVIKGILQKDNLKLVYNTSKPNIPTTVILDCSKAKKMLDWTPKTTIIKGLEKTISWYKTL